MAVIAHGVVIKRGGTPINEVKDTTPPALTRRPANVTKLALTDEDFVLGMRRSGLLVFALNWLTKDDATQQALLAAWDDGTLDSYELDFPDGGVWTFTGRVVQILVKTLPAEGIIEATVAVQVSGGVTTGASIPTDLILIEDGTPLLLENGDYLELD